MYIEPKNEEAACQAVMRVIEQRAGGPLTVSARPDTIERQQPAVELLFESPTRRYAMEHTRIESFPRQIAEGKAFSNLLEPLETELAGKVPGRFRLAVAVGATDGIRSADHVRVREQVKEWILSKASWFEADQKAEFVTETPPGVPFALTLARIGTHVGE
jgi:hypothetical protein